MSILGHLLISCNILPKSCYAWELQSLLIFSWPKAQKTIVVLENKAMAALYSSGKMFAHVEALWWCLLPWQQCWYSNAPGDSRNHFLPLVCVCACESGLFLPDQKALKLMLWACVHETWASPICAAWCDNTGHPLELQGVMTSTLQSSQFGQPLLCSDKYLLEPNKGILQGLVQLSATELCQLFLHPNFFFQDWISVATEMYFLFFSRTKIHRDRLLQAIQDSICECILCRAASDL